MVCATESMTTQAVQPGRLGSLLRMRMPPRFLTVSTWLTKDCSEGGDIAKGQSYKLRRVQDPHEGEWLMLTDGAPPEPNCAALFKSPGSTAHGARDRASPSGRHGRPRHSARSAGTRPTRAAQDNGRIDPNMTTFCATLSPRQRRLRPHCRPGFVPGLPHVILMELRQTLISYQDYYLFRPRRQARPPRSGPCTASRTRSRRRPSPVRKARSRSARPTTMNGRRAAQSSTQQWRHATTRSAAAVLRLGASPEA